MRRPFAAAVSALPPLAALLAAVLAVCAAGCDDSTADPVDGAPPAADVAVGLDAGPDAAPDLAVDGAAPDLALDGAAPDAVVDAGPATTLGFPVGESGPFAVGYRTWDAEYTVPGTGETRTIPVHAWYPAWPVEGAHPRFENLFDDRNSVVDAPPRDPIGGAYPVMVYSHGDRGFGGTSAFLMGRFASHGWLAVAPDHVGNLLVENPRGELVAHFIERPADITATVDSIADLPADDPLARADTARVVLSGHSRGVYTVWGATGAAYDLDAIAASQPEATAAEREAFAAGLGDERIIAAIGLAGGYREGWFGPDGWRAVTVPFQVQSGSADNPEALAALFDRVVGMDLTWVELIGACHQTFALGGCETFERNRGFSVVGTYALAFARRHLLGDDDPRTLGILDGSVEVDPAVTVRRR